MTYSESVDCSHISSDGVGVLDRGESDAAIHLRHVGLALLAELLQVHLKVEAELGARDRLEAVDKHAVLAARQLVERRVHLLQRLLVLVAIDADLEQARVERTPQRQVVERVLARVQVSTLGVLLLLLLFVVGCGRARHALDDRFERIVGLVARLLFASLGNCCLFAARLLLLFVSCSSCSCSIDAIATKRDTMRCVLILKSK